MKRIVSGLATLVLVIVAAVVFAARYPVNDDFLRVEKHLGVLYGVTGTNTTNISTNTGKFTSFPVLFNLTVGDETTDLTAAADKKTFRAPYAFTLTEVRASVNTAPTDATVTVDVNDSGTTVFSTGLTIDATEFTSTTAATPAVISDSAIADDAEITIDIDQIGSTIAGKGLKVVLIGTRSV